MGSDYQEFQNILFREAQPPFSFLSLKAGRHGARRPGKCLRQGGVRVEGPLPPLGTALGPQP